MNRLHALALAGCSLLLACSPASEPAKGGDFALLAQGVEGYQQAHAGYPLEFPRDHGPHPGFRIEWWYLTANLQDRAGREYGAQWTLFRTAMQTPAVQTASVENHTPDAQANPWQNPQVFMAHMAITTPTQHFSFQRYARGGDHGGIAQAGVDSMPFSAWLDDWSLQSAAETWLPLRVRGRQGAYGMDLQLDSDRPLVLQGNAGFSLKHPGGAGSYYYSQPFLLASGELEVDGRRVAVSGQAWLDREWSSQFLQPDQAGWDWFALHLDSGEKLMLFRLRARQSSTPAKDFLQAALIAADGTRTGLDSGQIELKVLQTATVAGRKLPLHWQIQLPGIARSLEVMALHAEQWMRVDFGYWEGVVLVTGDGPENSGRGYLELTGYSGQ